jgi:hypothetical protein
LLPISRVILRLVSIVKWIVTFVLISLFSNTCISECSHSKSTQEQNTLSSTLLFLCNGELFLLIVVQRDCYLALSFSTSFRAILHVERLVRKCEDNRIAVRVDCHGLIVPSSLVFRIGHCDVPSVLVELRLRREEVVAGLLLLSIVAA